MILLWSGSWVEEGNAVPENQLLPGDTRSGSGKHGADVEPVNTQESKLVRRYLNLTLTPISEGIVGPWAAKTGEVDQLWSTMRSTGIWSSRGQT